MIPLTYNKIQTRVQQVEKGSDKLDVKLYWATGGQLFMKDCIINVVSSEREVYSLSKIDCRKKKFLPPCAQIWTQYKEDRNPHSTDY